MKTQLTNEICRLMNNHLSSEQSRLLKNTLMQVFSKFSLPDNSSSLSENDFQQNTRLINMFIAAKRIEGCSDNTLKYYSNTLTQMLDSLHFY